MAAVVLSNVLLEEVQANTANGNIQVDPHTYHIARDDQIVNIYGELTDRGRQKIDIEIRDPDNISTFLEIRSKGDGTFELPYVLDALQAKTGTYFISGKIEDGRIGQITFNVIKLAGSAPASAPSIIAPTEFTVRTVSDAYQRGSIIDIQGKINLAARDPNQTLLTVQIFAPGSNLPIIRDSARPDSSGSFYLKLPTAGQHWSTEGEYRIKVTDPFGKIIEDTFLLTAPAPGSPSIQQSSPTSPPASSADSSNSRTLGTNQANNFDISFLGFIFESSFGTIMFVFFFIIMIISIIVGIKSSRAKKSKNALVKKIEKPIYISQEKNAIKQEGYAKPSNINLKAPDTERHQIKMSASKTSSKYTRIQRHQINPSNNRVNQNYADSQRSQTNASYNQSNNIAKKDDDANESQTRIKNIIKKIVFEKYIVWDTNIALAILDYEKDDDILTDHKTYLQKNIKKCYITSRVKKEIIEHLQIAAKKENKKLGQKEIDKKLEPYPLFKGIGSDLEDNISQIFRNAANNPTHPKSREWLRRKANSLRKRGILDSYKIANLRINKFPSINDCLKALDSLYGLAKKDIEIIAQASILAEKGPTLLLTNDNEMYIFADEIRKTTKLRVEKPDGVYFAEDIGYDNIDPKSIPKEYDNMNTICVTWWRSDADERETMLKAEYLNKRIEFIAKKSAKSEKWTRKTISNMTWNKENDYTLKTIFRLEPSDSGRTSYDTNSTSSVPDHPWIT